MGRRQGLAFVGYSPPQAGPAPAEMSQGPCDVGYSPIKLATVEASAHRAVTICLQPSSFLPLACFATMVLLMAENARWGFRTLIENQRCNVKSSTVSPHDAASTGIKSKRRLGAWERWRGLVLCLSSIYPIWYNHHLLFLYYNDAWPDLLAMQLFFTLTDNLCLLLRWSDIYPELQFVLRMLHVGFNLSGEGNKTSPRTTLFLVDDVLSIADTGIMEESATFLRSVNRLRRCGIAVTMACFFMLLAQRGVIRVT